MTSWSLNCSRMSSQMGVGGSSGSATTGCQCPRTWSAWGASRTVLAMLCAQRLDLLLVQALLLRHTEVPQRLGRCFCVCILHASFSVLRCGACSPCSCLSRCAMAVPECMLESGLSVGIVDSRWWLGPRYDRQHKSGPFWTTTKSDIRSEGKRCSEILRVPSCNNRPGFRASR